LDKRLAIAREIPRLRRFARALVRDRAAADDLVQDCLETGLARMHQLREPEKCRQWLFAILRNRFHDGLRSTSREPEWASLEDDEVTALPVAAVASDPVAFLSASDALASLPAEQREVLALVAVEGCTYKEAAQILAIPVGTLMSRLSRARERLRAHLEAPAPRGGHLRSVKP
jgi:RNA polymerase sigma-70 factor (ECF subfamily)